VAFVTDLSSNGRPLHACWWEVHWLWHGAAEQAPTHGPAAVLLFAQLPQMHVHCAQQCIAARCGSSS
jgi:hypothetical protein